MLNERLLWQGAMRLVKNRALKIRTPRGHGSGFYMGAFGENNKLGAVATALHVIKEANDWDEPIKLFHIETGQETLLPAVNSDGTKRPILVFDKSDLAVIIFTIPQEWHLPSDHIGRVASEQHMVEGVEVGWFGFPGIKADKLCFFHGYVSTYLDSEGIYLVDGVSINGVSGGPLLVIENNIPIIAGVVSAYLPNLAMGQPLPGMSMFTSISPAVPILNAIRDMSSAVAQADAQADARGTTPAGAEGSHEAVPTTSEQETPR